VENKQAGSSYYASRISRAYCGTFDAFCAPRNNLARHAYLMPSKISRDACCLCSAVLTCSHNFVPSFGTRRTFGWRERSSSRCCVVPPARSTSTRWTVWPGVTPSRWPHPRHFSTNIQDVVDHRMPAPSLLPASLSLSPFFCLHLASHDACMPTAARDASSVLVFADATQRRGNIFYLRRIHSDRHIFS